MQIIHFIRRKRVRFVRDKNEIKKSIDGATFKRISRKKVCRSREQGFFCGESQGHVLNFLEESNGIPEKEKPQSSEWRSIVQLA